LQAHPVRVLRLKQGKRLPRTSCSLLTQRVKLKMRRGVSGTGPHQQS